MNREQKIVFLKKKILDLKSTIKFKEDKLDEERNEQRLAIERNQRPREASATTINDLINDLTADYISLIDCIIDIYLLNLPVAISDGEAAYTALVCRKMEIYKDLSYVISNIKANERWYSAKEMYLFAQNIFGDEMIFPHT